MNKSAIEVSLRKSTPKPRPTAILISRNKSYSHFYPLARSLAPLKRNSA
jgi:hypothetical protein